ncbi:MAG: hypothetical protein PUB53_06025, partial [Bacteroidales bacterium]|nr:hypothetical protein [Bacteroidales bacterium]
MESKLPGSLTLSEAKIVQVSAKQKKTPQDFRLLGRAQPILSKDSASERKAKENSAGFSFAWPTWYSLMFSVEKVAGTQRYGNKCLHLHRR